MLCVELFSRPGSRFRQRQTKDADRAALAQSQGALTHCRTGCADVIHQEQRVAPHLPWLNPKCVLYIIGAVASKQPYLGRRLPYSRNRPFQNRNRDFLCEAMRQQLCLIIASLIQSSLMQRHGHDSIQPRNDSRPRVSHGGCAQIASQARRQFRSSLVLERVDGPFKWRYVQRGRPNQPQRIPAIWARRTLCGHIG